MNFLVFERDDAREAKDFAVVTADTELDARHVYAATVGIHDSWFREYFWITDSDWGFAVRFEEIDGVPFWGTEPDTGHPFLRFTDEERKEAFERNVREYFEGAPELADRFLELAAARPVLTHRTGPDHPPGPTVDELAERYPFPEPVLISAHVHDFAGDLMFVSFDHIRHVTATG